MGTICLQLLLWILCAVNGEEQPFSVEVRNGTSPDVKRKKKKCSLVQKDHVNSTVLIPPHGPNRELLSAQTSIQHTLHCVCFNNGLVVREIILFLHF